MKKKTLSLKSIIGQSWKGVICKQMGQQNNASFFLNNDLTLNGKEQHIKCSGNFVEIRQYKKGDYIAEI